MDQMLGLLIALVASLILICISELLWRYRSVDTEYTRKFVHISVGTFVAFWPFFLQRNEILAMSVAFVMVVLISNYFKLFKAMHSVQRPTWGEIFFAISVGALAYVAHSNWVYLAALLHMSLADGFAAITGTKFGKTTRYHVFGQPKSIVGTLTFFITSMIILVGYGTFTPNMISVWFLAVAAGATLIENIGVRGFDNLFVPIGVAVALNVLR